VIKNSVKWQPCGRGLFQLGKLYKKIVTHYSSLINPDTALARALEAFPQE
jgi:hypothetical protein